MRNAFVLDLNPLTVTRYRLSGAPVPICSKRSMIDRKIQGTRVASEYPSNSIEGDEFTLYIHMHQRFNRLLAFFLRDPAKFQPLNFFEYVLKCRYEHYLRDLLP